jgi:hypothetical protein
LALEQWRLYRAARLGELAEEIRVPLDLKKIEMPEDQRVDEEGET